MDVVKKGFGVAKKSLSLVGVLFVFNLVWNLATIFLVPNAAATPPGPGAPNALPVTQLTPGIAVAAFIFILLSVFMQAGMMCTVRDTVKTGVCALNSFIANGLKYFLRMLLLGLVLSLTIGLFIFLAVLFPALASAAPGGALINIAVVVAVLIGIAGLVLIMLWIFSPYVIINSDCGVGAGLKKSMEIVKKRFWLVIGTVLLVTLIIFGISFVVGLITGALMIAVQGTAGLVMNAFISSILNSFIGVIMTAAFMALYLRLATGTATSAAA